MQPVDINLRSDTFRRVYDLGTWGRHRLYYDAKATTWGTASVSIHVRGFDGTQNQTLVATIAANTLSSVLDVHGKELIISVSADDAAADDGAMLQIWHEPIPSDYAVPSGGSVELTVDGASVDGLALSSTTPTRPAGAAQSSLNVGIGSTAPVSLNTPTTNAEPAMRERPYYADDMWTTSSADVFQRLAISSGTLALSSAYSNTHPGVLNLRSSTTANSGVRVMSDTAALLIGGGEQVDILFNIATLTNLTLRMGFFDTSTSSDAVDGVYIEVPSTGLAVAKTSSNSTRTTSASFVTLVASVWYHARVTLNAGATLATYTIYNEAGTQLGQTTVNTNIPTGSGRHTGFGLIATNSGTAATDLVAVDFMSIGFSGRTLARGATT